MERKEREKKDIKAMKTKIKVMEGSIKTKSRRGNGIRVERNSRRKGGIKIKGVPRTKTLKLTEANVAKMVL